MREEWIEMLVSAVARLGSIQAVADIIGVSRASISTAIRGKYPSKSTRKLQERVLRKSAELTANMMRVECPPLGQEITLEVCSFMRMRRGAPSLPDNLRQWLACETCPVGARLMLPYRDDAKRTRHAQR